MAAPDSGASRVDERFRVAVLPFKCSGGNADLTALAEGLSEGIVAGLSRFSYFRVIARGAAAGDTSAAGSSGTQVAAQYVLEGSLRRAATRLRVAVQLVDSSSGAHLWTETYDRAFSPDAEFDVLDDLVPRIVCAVGDPHGVLPHAASEALRSKAPGQMTPYEAVLRSFAYEYRASSEEHALVRAGLERAVEQAPGYADAWAQLSQSLAEDYTVGFTDQPDLLGRALRAARRAIDAAPSNALGYQALARVLFYRKERQAFARYGPELSRFARGRLPRWARDMADTPDLVQDTLLQAFKHMDGFEHRGEGALRAYLRQAVMNRIRDELRRASRRPAAAALPVDAPDERPSPLEEAIGREATERYEAALARMKDDDREVLIARLELGLSYAEIAAATGRTSANAARMAVVRALLRLTEELGDGRPADGPS